ncbi:MAG: aerial mycelium formation protein [Mycobacteriales bacterium]
MTSFRQGGKRRIDRILDPDYLVSLPTMELDDLRQRRHEAEQEEVDLSYIRRLLQGHIDIFRAEQHRRAAGDEDDVVEHLAEVLADEQPAPAHGLGRHIALEPSEPGIHRRRYEEVLNDASLSNVRGLSDEALANAESRFDENEHLVSTLRRAVQQIMDRCSDEIARRYRDGEADVTSLLAGDKL